VNKFFKYLFLTLAVFIGAGKMFVPDKSFIENQAVGKIISSDILLHTNEICFIENAETNPVYGLIRLQEVSFQSSESISESSANYFRSNRKTLTDLCLFEEFRKIHISKLTSKFYNGYYIYHLRKLLI